MTIDAPQHQLGTDIALPVLDSRPCCPFRFIEDFEGGQKAATPWLYD